MAKPLTITDFARMGGKARAAALSPAELRAIALKGVAARRANAKKRRIQQALADTKKTA